MCCTRTSRTTGFRYRKPSKDSPSWSPRAPSVSSASATMQSGVWNGPARSPPRPGCPATTSSSTSTAICAPGPTYRPSSSPTAASAAADLLGYLRAEPALTLVAYSPLLVSAYTREDKPLPADYDHPGTPARLAALREVAKETGASVNQVVLAWQLGGPLPIVPLAGASSVAQLAENLAAVELELTAEQRQLLDSAL